MLGGRSQNLQFRLLLHGSGVEIELRKFRPIFKIIRNCLPSKLQLHGCQFKVPRITHSGCDSGSSPEP